ncbi:hypothetical protein HHK36_005789 [Tetracentron sinense]|uniref:Cytochrome P450 n=1 Tax=Tetracentron sinense TaxID=13715 RepID=A0A834ZPZ7_TETSI|nr:hypothetical protein HHK36_005789 [Tetracentron sinense]
MELQFPSVLTLFTFLFMLMLVKSRKRIKGNNSFAKLPPGPWKLPLIGNMHQFIGSLPHHSLRDLAMKHGPLIHLQLGEISTVVVSSPDVAKEVMKTHDLIFAQRPNLTAASIMSYDSTNIAFSPYGYYWRQLRKICISELLSTKRVQSFRSLREEEVSNLIRSISLTTRSPINLSEKIFSLTYSITSRAAFGKKCKDQEEFISILKEVIKLAGGFDIADVFPSLKLLHVVGGVKPKLQRMHKKVDRILENIIKDHRANEKTIKTSKGESGEEDLVDVLLKLQEHGDLEFPMTTDNIKAVILHNLVSPLLSFMELQFPSLLFSFFIFTFMVMKIGKRARAQIPNAKLPPGPWKLPLIGSMHHLVGSLPHHSLRDLAKKHGPLMHLQLGEVSAIIISSPKVAKEVFKTHDLTFADRPVVLAGKILAYDCTNIVFSPYGDYWRQLRKICNMELLSTKRVQSFHSLREEEVSKFIQSISSSIGSLTNLSSKIFSVTNSITARAAFGKKCKDQDVFILMVKEALILAGGFGVADIFPSLKLLHVLSGMRPKLERIHRKIDKILDDIINEHRANKMAKKGTNCESGYEDLVDVLLRLQECGGLEFPLTTNNIKGVILVSAIVISSPRVAKEVMKTHDLNFANRPEVLAVKILAYNCTNMVFSPYGDYWRQLRKICIMELLSVKRVQSFRSVREEEVSNLVQSISSSIGSLINLSTEIFSMTNGITSRAAFGKKCKDQDAFISMIKEAILLAGGFDVADVFPSLKLLHVLSGVKPKLERIHGKMDKILDDIIDEHKVNKTAKKTTNCESGYEDLVDVLLRLQECGGLEFPLTTNNIKAVILFSEYHL